MCIRDSLTVTRNNTLEAPDTYEGVLVITPTDAELEAAYPNYDFTIVPGTFTIGASTQKLEIASGSHEFTYNGADQSYPVYTVKFGGVEATKKAGEGYVYTLPTGDEVTITNPKLVKDVTTADVSNTFEYAVQNAGRYGDDTIEVTYGTLTVKPAEVTITVADASKGYGDPDPVFADAQKAGLYLGSELNAIDLTVTRNNTLEAPDTYEGVLVITPTDAELEAACPN